MTRLDKKSGMFRLSAGTGIANFCRAFATGMPLLCGVPAAISTPSPSIQRLMSDRVSMLDWGLEHLERDLQDAVNFEPTRHNAKLPDEAPIVTVDYDQNGGQIVISAMSTDEHVSDAVDTCRRMIAFLRNKLDPRWPDGKRRPDAHLWLIFFLHAGTGQQESTPKWRTLEKMIPPLVFLKVEIYAGRKNPTVCAGRLIDDSVTIRDNAR